MKTESLQSTTAGTKRRKVATNRPEDATNALPPVSTRAKASAAKRRPLLAKFSLDPAERHRLIETRAYFLAERRGFAPGAAVDDWLAAEKEVDLLFNAGSEMS